MLAMSCKSFVFSVGFDLSHIFIHAHSQVSPTSTATSIAGKIAVTMKGEVKWDT